MQLRDYQERCVSGLIEALEESQSALFILPTGGGKTICFASLIQRKDWGRVMVLAHREELIRQAADKIRRVTGEECDIEMADERADAHGMYRKARVVVSTIQTQTAGRVPRMERFNPHEFGLVIVDEAHHGTADSYKRVLDHYRQNPKCRIVGCTATPDRSDEEALGQVFDCAPFVYEIADAINDGWLVPIRVKSVFVQGLDYSDARTTAGDLNQGDVARAQGRKEVLQAMASSIYEIAAGRKTVVFATPGYLKDDDEPSRISKHMTDMLNSYAPNSARRVAMDTPPEERRRTLTDFRDGAFPFLVNVGILTEGWDEPTVECVAIARPTKSRALYAQMIGRGTRPLPGIVDGIPYPADRRRGIELSAKPSLEIIDLKGNAGRHKLVHAADVLGGKYSDEDVARAAEIADEDGGDVLEALEEAKQEREERIKEEEARKRRYAPIAAKFSVEHIDPFDMLEIPEPLVRGWDSGKLVTDAQRAVLERNGVEVNGMGRAQASAIIGEIKRRQLLGLPSFKQAKALRARGMRTDMSLVESLNAMYGGAR